MVFRSFIVIGAGHMGRFIVDELLRPKAVGTISSVFSIGEHSVSPLRSRLRTRFSFVYLKDRHASHPEWIAKGVNLATIDYDDLASAPSQLLRVSKLRLAPSRTIRMESKTKGF